MPKEPEPIRGKQDPFSLRDLFKGFGTARADADKIVKEVEAEMAAQKPAPEAATPARIPPAQIYKNFETEIAPLLAALKKLPADENGMEFFIRTDVVNDINGQPKDQRIDVWLFYTRDITDQPRSKGMPDSHLITMERKDSDPENPRYDITMELSLRPVLRLAVRPYDKTRQIEALQYIEYFETPEHGHEYPVFLGGYGQVHDVQERKQLANIQDFTAELDHWIKSVADTKAPQILHAIGGGDTKLRHDVTISKPLQLKKKTPDNRP
jgi:hypothetical protein